MTATRIRTFTVEGPALDLFVSDCANCGVVFGIPKNLEKRRRDDKGSFYCPNGHSLVFGGKTDEEKLREQLDAARSLANRESERRRLAESQRAAARGEVTKIRKRVGNGVCPCCNRSFADLAQHIAGQHPDFRLDENEPDTGIRVDDLSPNQVDALQRIGNFLDRGEEGYPASYLHRSTVRALASRLVLTVEERFDDEFGEDLEIAVPTAMGLRLIAEAGSAR